MEYFRAREAPAQRLARLRADIQARAAASTGAEFDSASDASDQAVIEEKWVVDSPFASRPLASDPVALASERMALREAMQKSPLLDPALLARSLEKTFLEAFRL